MRLQQWANWAEIIASFAVVVTLLILIQEVRGNTLALERQADSTPSFAPWSSGTT